jgi:GMP synthase-like glutamine amidotransferase
MINPGSPELSYDEERDMYYDDKRNDTIKEAIDRVKQIFGDCYGEKLAYALARSVRDEDEDAEQIWYDLWLGDSHHIALCGTFQEFCDHYHYLNSSDGE